MKKYVIKLPFQYESQDMYFMKMSKAKLDNKLIMRITEEIDEAFHFNSMGDVNAFIKKWKSEYSDLLNATICEVVC